MLPETNDDLRSVIVITPGLAIPESELAFRFSRSSGPGGQHVQRSDTRVELLFDVANSPSLTEEQRARILARLRGHIDNDGMMRLVSSASRSQLENRADVVTRFQMLLAIALRREKRRVATKPTAAAREQRLAAKKLRGRNKAARRPVRGDED